MAPTCHKTARSNQQGHATARYLFTTFLSPVFPDTPALQATPEISTMMLSAAQASYSRTSFCAFQPTLCEDCCCMSKAVDNHWDPIGSCTSNSSSIIVPLPRLVQVFLCGVILLVLLCPVVPVNWKVRSSGLIKFTLYIYWKEYLIRDGVYFLTTSRQGAHKVWLSHYYYIWKCWWITALSADSLISPL